MGLFDFFKSDEEKVRSKIRKGFDGCVRTAVKSAGTNDSFMLGILQKTGQLLPIQQLRIPSS